MKSSFVYNTIIGDLHFFEDLGYITKINFGREEDPDYVEYESEAIKKAYLEISEYLSGKRKEFTILFKAEGTEFQKKVWEELQKIPYGETRSYGEVAKRIGNPKAGRAVGNANNKNPISIIVPWHRVIGANGSLVGFGGGLDIKKMLLDIEKQPLAK